MANQRLAGRPETEIAGVWSANRTLHPFSDNVRFACKPSGTLTASIATNDKADSPVWIWLDERTGELAPIDVQFALSGPGIHDRGTLRISYV